MNEVGSPPRLAPHAHAAEARGRPTSNSASSFPGRESSQRARRRVKNVATSTAESYETVRRVSQKTRKGAHEVFADSIPPPRLGSIRAGHRARVRLISPPFAGEGPVPIERSKFVKVRGAVVR